MQSRLRFNGDRSVVIAYRRPALVGCPGSRTSIAVFVIPYGLHLVLKLIRHVEFIKGVHRCSYVL